MVALRASLICSVNCVPAEFIEDETNVGRLVSITMACAPAMLFAPEGTDVEVIAFPAVSVGALVNTYDDTAKSLLLSPTPTVYVPVKVVPVALVSTTVSPVFNVTVSEAPFSTVSLKVAVMLMVAPTT